MSSNGFNPNANTKGSGWVWAGNCSTRLPGCSGIGIRVRSWEGRARVFRWMYLNGRLLAQSEQCHGPICLSALDYAFNGRAGVWVLEYVRLEICAANAQHC